MALSAKALIGAGALATLLVAPLVAGDGFGGGFWFGGAGGGSSHSGGGTSDGGYHRGEARIVTVDANGGSEFRSINAAIQAAGWGGTVKVKSGIYVESLDIKRPVTIVGEVHEPGEFPLPVQVEAPPDKPCANISVAESGFVGLMQIGLRAGSANVQRACVELHRGFLAVKDATIVAPSYVSAVIARGGHLSIENTSISGGREGVLITASDMIGGLGSVNTFYLVHNKIANNITGVKVDALAQVNIVGNDIYNNSNDGVIYFQGRGTIIGNDIHDNKRSGVVLQDGNQSPTVRANKIFANVGSGIEIVPGTTAVTPELGRPIPVSRGEICDNLISGNRGSAIDSKVDSLSLNCKNDISGNRDNRRGHGWQRGVNE